MEEHKDDINFDNRIPLEDLKNAVNDIKAELAKVIVGQEKFVELLIVSLLVDGHVLIEGVPGIAKTVTAKLFAKTLKTDFSRIQFTPDLMPSDILGSEILDESRQFKFIKGPIFANIILADEINRTPPKTQAALLEAMQERVVTVAGHQYKLNLPYFVLATQNPIEQEGTYRLPEAQLDRFLFKIDVDYPNLDEEIEILSREHQLRDTEKTDAITSFLTAKQIAEYQNVVTQILVEKHLLKYIAELIVATRSNPFLYFGWIKKRHSFLWT